MKNKIVFETVDIDGNSLKLAVVRPSAKEQSEGDTVYNRAFREAYEKKLFIAAEVANMLRERKIWTQEKQDTLDKVDQSIFNNVKKLYDKNIPKLDRRKVAIETRQLRNIRMALASEQSELDNMTCEVAANNERFNYWVAVCTVDPEQGREKPYFADLDDYKARSTEDAAIAAATNMVTLLYDVVSIRADFPENKFLGKFGYIDDKLNLIDPTKKYLCDTEFRRVNSDGNWVMEDGVTLCDAEGKPIPVVDEDFPDDEPEPIKENVLFTVH